MTIFDPLPLATTGQKEGNYNGNLDESPSSQFFLLSKVLGRFFSRKVNKVYLNLPPGLKTISHQLIEPNSKQEAVSLKVQYQRLIKKLGGSEGEVNGVNLFPVRRGSFHQGHLPFPGALLERKYSPRRVSLITRKALEKAEVFGEKEIYADGTFFKVRGRSSLWPGKR